MRQIRQKLLKAPVRRLLLTFFATAGMTASTDATKSGIAPAPAISHHASATTRLRQKTDYSQIEGIQRWGLNE